MTVKQELKAKSLELAVKYFVSLSLEMQQVIINKHKEEAKSQGEEYDITRSFFVFADQFLEYLME
jgi:hypothetical protein